MVEYAVLVAHNTSNTLHLAAGKFLSWASGVGWEEIAYAAGALLLVRIIFWVFRPT
jgi:hypothetical protein